MGGIVGSGIFMNPSVVARYVPSAGGILLAWVAGGAIALLGGGPFAELASRRPRDGGLYAHMCDAFHPSIGLGIMLAGLPVYAIFRAVNRRRAAAS
jgi:APA family basic amino acid/polyamine antiporter